MHRKLVSYFIVFNKNPLSINLTYKLYESASRQKIPMKGRFFLEYAIKLKDKICYPLFFKILDKTIRTSDIFIC